MRHHRTRVALAALFLFPALLVGCAHDRGFDFAITADMRYDTPPDCPSTRCFQGACEALRVVGPGDFMVSPGDLDPPDRIRATLDATLGPDYVWYPVVGNHDAEHPDTMKYLRAYNAGGTKLPRIVRSGPPGAVETCYSFDYGCAHFVAINQYYDGTSDAKEGGDISPALYDWLAADLAANHQPITLVFGHEPTASLADMDTGRVRHRGDSLDANDGTNHRFWTLLRKHRVTAFVCGHTHDMSLAKINGVWQINIGHTRGHADEEAPSTFMKVRVEPTGIRCDIHRLNLTTDKYELTHSEWLQ
jgi:hypothetical protein